MDTSPPQNPDFRETALAEKLGLSVATLAEQRATHLREGEHFEKNGARVFYTPAGVAALHDRLHVPGGEKNGAPAATATPHAPVRFLVTRRVVLNCRLLHARELLEGKKNGVPREVCIRVRDNRKYQIGGEIAATPPPAGTAHWIAVGRPPRRHRVYRNL